MLRAPARRRRPKTATSTRASCRAGRSGHAAVAHDRACRGRRRVKLDRAARRVRSARRSAGARSTCARRQLHPAPAGRVDGERRRTERRRSTTPAPVTLALRARASSSAGTAAHATRPRRRPASAASSRGRGSSSSSAARRATSLRGRRAHSPRRPRGALRPAPATVAGRSARRSQRRAGVRGAIGYTGCTSHGATTRLPRTTPHAARSRASGSTAPTASWSPTTSRPSPTINEGEVVHGTVVRVDKDEVLVDIGYKSEGVIPVAELSIRRSVNPADEVSLGDEIDALVLTKEDAEGRLILSKKRARFELAWKNIERAAESRRAGQRPRDRGRQGRPDPRPRRARLPARVARRHPPRAGPGRVPRQGAALQGDRAQPLAQQRRALAPRRARGGAQGAAPGDPRPAPAGRRRRGPDLEHRRLRRLRRPRRHGRPDPHLRALVDRTSTTRPRCSRSARRSRSRCSTSTATASASRSASSRRRPTRGSRCSRATSEGDVVEGRVTKVVTFGAFVEILPGVEGLVHISELAQHHVENPREVVSQGDAVNVKIIEVDAERRRLSLSLKRVEAGEDPQPPIGGGEIQRPTIDLSEDVFPEGSAAAPAEAVEVGRRRPPRLAEADAEPAEDGSPRRGRCRARGRRPSPRPSRAGGRRRAGGRAEPEAVAEPERRAGAGRAGSTRGGRRAAGGRVLRGRARVDVAAAGRGRRSPAASAPARARRSQRSRATARRRALERRDRPRLLREDDEVKARARRALRAEVLDEAARSTAPRSRAIVFGDREQLALARGAAAPARRRRVPRLARAAGRAPEAAGGLRHRGAAALRGRRRDALRRGGRDHGARRSCARSGPRSRSTTAARGCIPDEEKLRRADFAYVNDGTLEELDAFVDRRDGGAAAAGGLIVRRLLALVVLAATAAGVGRLDRDRAAAVVPAAALPAALPGDRRGPRAQLPTSIPRCSPP